MLFVGELFLIVGVFSPVINWCGGAELVAVNIINTLKENGHQVILLSNKSLNQTKLKKVFGENVIVDQQIVFPLRFFSPTNYHNIYTDALRSIMLKLKCEIVIDVYSNAILPGVDTCYIHYPLLTGVKDSLPYLRNKIYFSPYQSFLHSNRKNIDKKLIFANSGFTAKAIKTEFGINPHVLYPPISNSLLDHNKKVIVGPRETKVITVARISEGKNLDIIPYIAQSTRKEISFTIVGLLDSIKVLNSLKSLIKKLNVSYKVKILTNISRDQLRSLFLNSRVYLHPTINEHFGISIVESMASGCIPVVHDSGGPREFVSQAFRYNNVEEAAKKVEKAVSYWSPLRAREMTKYADRFSGKNFSKHFIELFNSHLNRDI